MIQFCSILFALALTGVGAAQAADKDALTEAQAMGVMLMSNAAEVQIGQAMAARTADPKVRAYAMRLLDDNLKANRELLGIVENTGILAADSKLRDQRYAAGMKEVGALWTTEPGTALDKKFLTEAVEDHVEYLEIIDTRLLPSATTEELKTSFTAMRATMAAHLQEACQLGAPMGVDAKGCPTQPGTR
jgi:putative membrane protein